METHLDHFYYRLLPANMRATADDPLENDKVFVGLFKGEEEFRVTVRAKTHWDKRTFPRSNSFITSLKIPPYVELDNISI